MAKVAVALGSNLNNPHHQLRQAANFLKRISSSNKKSSIYKSEPIGPSNFDFLNAVILIDTDLNPNVLYGKLREQEKKQGRPSRYPKWSARPIDLDIITYDKQVVSSTELTIPHAEYNQRLFVLLPLQEVLPNWVDPISNLPIKTSIELAPTMSISKSDLNW